MAHRLIPHVWLPNDRQPLRVTSMGDAFSLAIESDAMPDFTRVLVLLDRLGIVLTMHSEPPADLLTRPQRFDHPSVRPVSASLLLSHEELDWGPPSTHDVRWFTSLRELHATQGVRLLDWIHIDRGRDLFRSMASAVDGDAAWSDHASAS